MQPKRTLQITPRWFLTRWTTSAAVFGILPSYFLLSVCDSFIVPITIYGCVMCWYSKAAQSFVKGAPVFEAICYWKIWPWFHKYYFQTHRTGKKVGLVPSGTTPLLEPMSTLIYVAIWSHYATMWWTSRDSDKCHSLRQLRSTYGEIKENIQRLENARACMYYIKQEFELYCFAGVLILIKITPWYGNTLSRSVGYYCLVRKVFWNISKICCSIFK